MKRVTLVGCTVALTVLGGCGEGAANLQANNAHVGRPLGPSIAYGQTLQVLHAPSASALASCRFDADAGDEVTVRVSAPGGEALSFVLDEQGKLVKGAVETTVDFRAPATGTYLVRFLDRTGTSDAFIVQLARRGGPSAQRVSLR